MCLAGLVSGVLFLILQVEGTAVLAGYLERTDLQEQYIEEQVASLQEYVTQYGLSAGDSWELTQWVKKNPLTLMEIYRSNVLIYTSWAPAESSGGDNDLEAPYYDWVSYYQVQFSDGPAEVVLYSGETYRWFACLTIASLLLSFLTFLIIFVVGSRKLVRYICQLSDQIQAMEGGDLDQEILVKGDHELSSLARGLDSMRRSFREQREREKELYRTYQTMITQMSHDLRTPLTAIQIYTDILRYRRFESTDQAEEYLGKIDGKISQIKQLAENIFEYSLISGEQRICLEPPRAFRDVLHDCLSEMAGYLESQGLSLCLESDRPTCAIRAYSPYIRRLMDNIASNLVKYADPAVPVRVAMEEDGQRVFLSFRNAVGDGSSHRDGSGIGLSNMCAMMERQHGSLEVERQGEEFWVTLCFPAC